MIKLGGYICDYCRNIIHSKPLYWRKSKKGKILHYCNAECSLKETNKNKKVEYVLEKEEKTSN